VDQGGKKDLVYDLETGETAEEKKPMDAIQEEDE